jgi:hypothetical protein
MQVDRGGYLLVVSSLALGGVGGYVASERDLVPHLQGNPRNVPPAPVSAEPVRLVVDAGPPPVDASILDAGPACDDSVGDAEACPPPGYPAVEGGCGAFPTTRCNDFKQTMKPRVAQAAVACLNKLTGAERCDPKRVDLCAHLALMNACDDRAATTTIGAACEGLVQACASAPVGPSRAECRLVLSGLRENGRDAVVDCTKKHCTDRGLQGCQAAVPGKP